MTFSICTQQLLTDHIFIFLFMLTFPLGMDVLQSYLLISPCFGNLVSIH